MAVLQSNFAMFHGSKVEGQTNSGVPLTIESKTVADGVTIGFGKAGSLVGDTGVTSVITSGVYAGIAVRKFKTVGLVDGTSVAAYTEGETAEFITDGIVVMKAVGSIAQGQLYINAAGALSNGATGDFLVEGGSVLALAADGQLVDVSLNGNRNITIVA